MRIFLKRRISKGQEGAADVPVSAGPLGTEVAGEAHGREFLRLSLQVGAPT